VVDYLINIVAPLLSVTLYSNAPVLLSILLLVPALFVWALPPNAYSRRKKPRLPPSAHSKQGAASGPLGTLSRKPFLTSYRGGMIALTCIAILAVDFRLFPRRFAKVETWGTSLMDLGVGSFVFSAGVVAARPVLKERAERRPTPMVRRILLSLRHSLPLFVLGIVRTLSVKGLDYAEHVTEYGVHWNFFFTLGLLPPFVAAFQSALRIVPSFAVLAIVLGVPGRSGDHPAQGIHHCRAPHQLFLHEPGGNLQLPGLSCYFPHRPGHRYVHPASQSHTKWL
jgi:phosphatidylinositol glycan class W